MSLYQKTAKEIIQNSIKSAILIDEKAWAPFEEKPDTGDIEIELSEKLYNNFKENKMSLAIHKYQTGDEDKGLHDYLFCGRDLVLLDWKLKGDKGEDVALKFLSKIIEQPEIHFCSIYTSEDNKDDILHNILSFFSGETKDSYKKISDALKDSEINDSKFIEFGKQLSIYRDEGEKKGQTIKQIRSSDRDKFQKIHSLINAENIICSMIKYAYALSDNFEKSEEPQPCPEFLNTEKFVLVINSTIVTILEKRKDTDPKDLVSRISEQISSTGDSYIQLLGLEMQNLIKSKGAFISKDLISVDQKTFLYHRGNVVQENGNDDLFHELIREVLLQNINTQLSVADLRLLDKKLLNEKYEDEINSTFNVDKKDLWVLNTFYNSIKLEGNRKITFGDVFKCKRENKEFYLLCITPLCDCFRAEKKIKLKYYFVEGIKLSDNSTLEIGDSGFINYIGVQEAINWSTKGGSHQPMYIKPIIYKVRSDEIIDNKIECILLSENGDEIIKMEAEYITTIKQNYAQRIANHAFAYPMRVGVDFAKYKKK